MGAAAAWQHQKIHLNTIHRFYNSINVLSGYVDLMLRIFYKANVYNFFSAFVLGR